MGARIAGKLSLRIHTSLYTSEPTRERNPTCVQRAGGPTRGSHFSPNIWQLTEARKLDWQRLAVRSQSQLLHLLEANGVSPPCPAAGSCEISGQGTGSRSERHPSQLTRLRAPGAAVFCGPGAHGRPGLPWEPQEGHATEMGVGASGSVCGWRTGRPRWGQARRAPARWELLPPGRCFSRRGGGGPE